MNPGMGIVMLKTIIGALPKISERVSRDRQNTVCKSIIRGGIDPIEI
jgi:hypothetical protein